MAVVVAPQDVEQFLAYAKEENLEATEVAVVTEEPRLILEWRGKTLSIFPVHSSIPTVRIRKQMSKSRCQKRKTTL